MSRQLGWMTVLSVAAVGCGGDNSQPPDTRNNPATVVTNTTSPAPQVRNARLPFEHDRPTQPRLLRPDDWFEDVTDRSDVDFAYRDGNEAGFYHLMESLGGGVAIFDFDRDGDMDLFFTGGGRLTGPPVTAHGLPGKLYRNDGDWHFTDVTAAAGLDKPAFYTHGCTVGDFDRDGWDDLFIAGYGGVQLWRNLGSGRFEDITTQAQLKCDDWGVTGACADYDRDGWLDLYLVTYCDRQADFHRLCKNDQGLRDTCGPTHFRGSPDKLWRNRGDGTFEDVTGRAGFAERNRGLGVVAGDLNGDDWIDFYVANDVEENLLYLGGPQLPFQSVGVLAGAAFSATGEREASMGIDLGDYDGDGRPDLWYTNYTHQDNTLLQKVDGFGFANHTASAGMAGVSRPWVGFGTGFADFDGDGWQDVFVANGHVAYERLDSPYFQPAQLFRNEAGTRYVEITDRAGPYFSIPHAGRGAAVGDLDDDGAPDLVIVHQNDPVTLLRNRNDVGPWVQVLLVGTDSNPNAVGATATVRSGGRSLTRFVRGGGGYLAHFDPRLLFALSERRPVDVTVRWPNGVVEVFSDLPAETTHVLIEGDGQRSASDPAAGG